MEEKIKQHNSLSHSLCGDNTTIDIPITGRLLVCGKTAEDCSKSLPISHQIPQGLLAYRIANFVFTRDIDYIPSENPWVQWASKSTNNLGWLYLFAYKALNQARINKGYSNLYSSQTRDRLGMIRRKAWGMYMHFRDFNACVDAQLVDRNSNFYTWLGNKEEVNSNSRVVIEELNFKLKKRTKRCPFPRLLEGEHNTFGMHTEKMYTKYVVDVIAKGNSRAFTASKPSLVDYYLRIHPSNELINQNQTSC